MPELRTLSIKKMNNAQAFEVCEYCDGIVELGIVRAHFRYNNGAIYIDGVPAGVCNHCGEQYFDAEVYKRMEEIARNRKKIKKTVCFPLADFETASI